MVDFSSTVSCGERHWKQSWAYQLSDEVAPPLPTSLKMVLEPEGLVGPLTVLQSKVGGHKIMVSGIILRQGDLLL